MSCPFLDDSSMHLYAIFRQSSSHPLPQASKRRAKTQLFGSLSSLLLGPKRVNQSLTPAKFPLVSQQLISSSSSASENSNDSQKSVTAITYPDSSYVSPNRSCNTQSEVRGPARGSTRQRPISKCVSDAVQCGGLILKAAAFRGDRRLISYVPKDGQRITVRVESEKIVDFIDDVVHNRSKKMVEFIVCKYPDATAKYLGLICKQNLQDFSSEHVLRMSPEYLLQSFSFDSLFNSMSHPSGCYALCSFFDSLMNLSGNRKIVISLLISIIMNANNERETALHKVIGLILKEGQIKTEVR